MPIHRLKHSFSAGELSPMMDARLDFKRYNNGCKKLRNMVCATQGPATRRSGFRFIYDLNSIGLDPADGRVRLIPFVFSETQAVAMVFFVDTNGDCIVVFGDKNGLAVYPATSAVDCPTVPIDSPEYTGAGDYVYEYQTDTAADVRVEHVKANGDVVPLVQPTDYTVQLDTPATGSHTLVVTYAAAPASGTLDIYHVRQRVAGEIVSMNLGPAAAKDHVEGDGDTGWDIEHFDWAQSADEMYFAMSGVQPSILKRYSNTCWTFALLEFTDQPTDWSDDYGWPERVTFHQQRLVYAANLLKRQTVWMSRAGSFLDFGQETTIIDSDAVTFTLDSGTQNKIVWMNSAKSLNVGTIGNEWTVTGSTRTALTPSNVLAQRQTNNGGEANKPLMVGITTLFVETYGRVVNEFVYDYTYDSYKTSDMSVLSNHVTEHYSITDWTYQQTPDSIIWSVREDGDLLGITYQRDHEVVGWHVHDTSGLFKAITSVPGDTREDEVWTIVNRTINGQDKYYLEKKADSFSSDSSIDARFMDCFTEYVGDPVRVLSNLDHLEGTYVDILADGTVHPQLFVSNGSIELNKNYSNIAVGLHTDAEVWPHLSEIPTSTGTAFGRMQRCTQLAIDFYNSLGCSIGKWDSEDGESVDELPFRVPGDLTGEAVPLYTGIYNLDFHEGFDRQLTYFIRQTQPLPLTIRGVTDTIEVFE